MRLSIRTLGCSLCGLLLALSPAIEAGGLLTDYGLAKDNDPSFAASIADNETAKIEARLAGMAYYPRAQASIDQAPDESEPRQTIAITQPLIDYNRWLQLKEEAPRMRAAEADLEASEQELARKLLDAVGKYVSARESLRLNVVTIKALESELESAENRYKRGIGTVTDVYDTRLRLARAQAERYANDSALAAARREYSAIVGQPLRLGAYTLATEHPPLALPPVDDLLVQAEAANPRLRSAQVSLELADLGQSRALAEYIPSVNARAQQTWYEGDSDYSMGVQLGWDLPVDASRIFSGQTAALEVTRAKDQLRAAQQETRLEVQQLHAAVLDAQARLRTLEDAIEAAELSLLATERSFEGGFRTKIDVINAILARDETRISVIEAIVDLGKRWFDLQLLAAVPVTEALAEVDVYLFGRAN